MARPLNSCGIKWNPKQLVARRALSDPRLSCDDIAEKCSVGGSTVRRWESGQEPTEKQLAKLAKIFKCQPRDFSRKVKV